jgi:menaquinone-specific isochorismate synthase
MQEIDPLDLPSWLAAQTLFPKFYLKCPRTGIETVALGSHQEFFEIPKSPKERVYGSLPFPSNKQDFLWEDFSAPFFFIPQVEIFQSEEKTVLKVRGTGLLFNVPEKKDSYLFLGKQTDLPSLETWESSVHAILEKIRSKQLKKAVLARRSSFEMHGSPFTVLKALLDSSYNSSVFAFQRTPDSLFLGATPEMLYQRSDRSLTTVSIAGTRKRGEDLLLSQELLSSVKDGSEISYVKDFLSESLSSLCESFSCETKDSIIKTSHLLHLYNRLDGTLKSEINDIDILSCLHPTPAVGALPREPGIKEILSLEPFDRGLYAGALGWISPLESSFVVTIRSALIKEGVLHAFAGTGIVEGSDPQLEWQELEHKISHWKNLLCHTPL